jgi:transcription initiation factor TFIIIB Brf1 subunit/transcription initiation factor TFIIB
MQCPSCEKELTREESNEGICSDCGCTVWLFDMSGLDVLPFID